MRVETKQLELIDLSVCNSKRGKITTFVLKILKKEMPIWEHLSRPPSDEETLHEIESKIKKETPFELELLKV